MPFPVVQAFQFRPVLFKMLGKDVVDIAGYGHPVSSGHAHNPFDRFVVFPADIYRFLCAAFRLAEGEVLAFVGFLFLLSSENVDVQFHVFKCL